MKGIIFTEFISIVEQNFGLDISQQMFDDANDSGIYTAVGSYDHRQLIKLIISLSNITGISPSQLQQTYGRLVFPSLLKALPIPNIEADDTLSFIRKVEQHIHLEVKKLYPDATPPKFIFNNQTQSTMTMDYHSSRCMGHVCMGLLEGCAHYFNQSLTIIMQPMNDSQNHVRFSLTLTGN
ncbi:heme NO-binding domain-containing protein [Photobacterium aquimaris]|uniref:Guanylate cyclase n=1 Tax=Photobacterium aquimaris TaxID=512643 RepID=A0A2T3HWA7_9GAMM|nr:heme NO-binding domain-containing protein [Photobacterium aquimaris]MCP4955852.1 guanylate cyclase [Photobacterium aquimaris]OBU15451.1 guanylate cyclase [Photobacterium aquimaris]PQJ38558.1 guanylate cyclase [Photobacterium aquimaris]PSU03014.1 guanylate cyclase [Photobacterium aquimaris]